MYPASSRHRDRRPRSARTPARRPDLRSLLETLEPRQLMAAQEVSWVKVSASNLVAASAGVMTYTTDGARLTEYNGPQDMGSIPTTGTVMAATSGYAYTNEVAKYGILGGLHLEWSHPDFPGVIDVAAASDGSVYIAGTYTQAFDADPGPGAHTFAAPANSGRNAYLVKLDADGNFLWGNVVGGDGSSGVLNLDHGPRLGVDAAGNSYVAVNYVPGFRPPYDGGGIELMKFDPAGRGAWAETIGSFDSWVTALAVGPSGEVAVAGVGNMDVSDLQPRAGAPGGEHWPDGSPQGYGGQSFVARYDTSGALSWAQRPQPNSETHSSSSANAIDISPRGDVVVVVGANDGVASFSLLQRYDTLGNLLNQQAYDAYIDSVANGVGSAQPILTGSFSGTVNINPGYETYNITAPAGATSAGFVLDLIDPDSSSTQRLVGTPVGTPGSWNDSGNDLTKALDNNTATYFDAPTSQAWVGYDFGHATIVNSVSYVPRTGDESRMVDGQFQGSNDGTNWTTVATITATPKTGTTNSITFAAPVTYRYMRYLSPVGGFGNAAEISFNGAGPEAYPPDAPLHPVASWDGNQVRLNWTDLATNETGYKAELFDNPNFTGTPVATAERGSQFYFLTFYNFKTPGTYYARIESYNSYNHSPWVSAGSVTVPGTPATAQLAGTPIGTPGSWSNSGNDLTKAFDGDTTTFFDAPIGDAWVGLDLGTATALDHVRFFPRAGLAWRMVDGTFQGSNDGANWTTLATISSEPAEGTYTTMSLGGGSYRYVRYQGAAWGSGNVAELQFYGTRTQPPPSDLPAAPTGLTLSVGSSLLTVTWTDNATNETGYTVDYSTSPDFTPGTPGSGSSLLPANSTSDTRVLNPGVTYYVRVRATNSAGASAYATADPVTGTAVRITGTPIGTPGSWNNSGNDLTKAFDGNTTSFFDAPTGQAWVGYDFGAPAVISAVTFYPRLGQESRMVGGQFRVSDDGVNWTRVGGVISQVPPANAPTTMYFTDQNRHRYIEYLSPDGGYGNVAELQFYGLPPSTPAAPKAPATVIGFALNHTTIQYNWPTVENATGYEYQLSTRPDFSTLVASGTSVGGAMFSNLATGVIYYFRVRATNAGGTSAYTQANQVVLEPDSAQPVRLVGSGFGTPGSWNNTGNTFDKALDDNPDTFFDAPTSQAYVGLDLGTPRVLTSVRYLPRTGLGTRMMGGLFQASNDNANWTTVATITRNPTDGQYSTLTITDPTAYRYVRYLSPVGGMGNVAELQFFGEPIGGDTPPVAPTGVTGTVVGGNSIHYAWADVDGETSYDYQFSTSPAFDANLITRTNSRDVTAADFGGGTPTFPPGTYYFRVRAVNLAGASAYVTAAPITIGNPAPTSFPLTGTAIGTAGSWNNSGNDFTKALDGNPNTFFDAPTSQAYVGLHQDGEYSLTAVHVTPRAGFNWRVPGAQIQTSLDGVTWTTVYTINSAPPDGTATAYAIPATAGARYVRYLSPDGGFGNVAEVQFDGYFVGPVP